jgi:hypothetical protein
MTTNPYPQQRFPVNGLTAIRKLCQWVSLLAAAALGGLCAHGAILQLRQESPVLNHLRTGAGLAGQIGSTPGQFQSAIFLGISAPVTSTNNPVPAPSGLGGRLVYVRGAAPYLGKAFAFLFGAVIPPPDTDENGNPLADPEAYWASRPFVETDRLGFEWSDQANQVVAKEAGTYAIVWQKSAAEPGTPSDLAANPLKYHSDSGLYFRLYTNNHSGVLAGDIIHPPSTREDGSTPAAAGYWVSRPHTLRATTKYYYSQAADAVFATQVGPVSLTWKRQAPSSGQHAGDPDYFEEGGNYFRLFTQQVVVSGSAVKQPRKIYWTGEGDPGRVVHVPKARIAGVNIIFNSEFPEHVPVSEGIPINQSTALTTEGNSSAAAFTKTLWYSEISGGFNALNREGRIFVEYLGSISAANPLPEHLGFEVVDVARGPQVETSTAELGERIAPLFRASDALELTPMVANSPEGEEFMLQDFSAGGGISVLYAVKETRNPNDFVLWWLEPGEQGVLWPLRYIRYELKWPSDVAAYSHYFRPTAATPSEAQATAVQLDGRTAPLIQYQDPLDQPRAQITGDFKFYTWLSGGYNVHRTLLRRMIDGRLVFERVYSWLDSTVLAGNFAGTLASELDAYNATTGSMVWPDELKAPRIVERSVPVGERIAAPNGESNTTETGDYLAGHINPAYSADYNPNAYINPFTDGFEESALGAIIPVNARPGNDLMEVWWFRKSRFNTGTNAIYWPSVIGRYTIRWPSDEVPPEFATDFAGGAPAGMAVNGSGFVAPDLDGNDRLVLTQPQGGEKTSVIIGDLKDGEWVGSFVARFKVKVFKGTQSFGGGWSFNFAGDIPDSIAASFNQDGFGSGLRVTFDTFDNGGADTAPAIDVVYNGSVLQSVSMAGGSRSRPVVTAIPNDVFGAPLSLNTGTNWVEVEIRLRDGGLVDVSWGGVAVLSGVQTPYLPASGWRFAFTATTGTSVSQGQEIDDLSFALNQGVVREIVLASNDGTGPLSNVEAKGAIYVQNDSSLPGYNPNEEHALMQGGQGYALRDDLNRTGASNFSSEPYVLIEYTAADGRLAMSAFHVLREKPEEGITFDYVVEAPRILQAPMPLPLLELPLDEARFNLNTEVTPGVVTNSVINLATLISTLRTIRTVPLLSFRPYVLQSPGLTQSRSLFVTEYNPDTRQVFGVVSSHETVAAVTKGGGTLETMDYGYGYGYFEDQPPIAYFDAPDLPPVAIGERLLLASPGLGASLTVTVASTNGIVVGVNVPATHRADVSHTNFWTGAWITRYVFDSLFIAPDTRFVIPDTGIVNGMFETWWLAKDLQVPFAAGNRYTFQDRKGNLWVYRGPHNEAGPNPNRSFEIQYYYKTLPGFYFPSLSTQPAIGTIVPYLRPRNTSGSFVGSAAGFDFQALPITYLPAWPKDAPEMFRGETLTAAKRGLPAVRGQTSAEIFYQQSIFNNGGISSAVLHDPTREKEYFLGAVLSRIPDSVRTDAYLGKTFFPELPPHLVEQFFFDGLRGAAGALVLKGEFVQAALGESYLLLNTLGAGDVAALKGLATNADPNKAAWDAAIDGLSTTVERFVEDTGKPGTYIADAASDEEFDGTNLARITDDDQAVDSYALTAAGPGAGYVTLLFGNGEAFTPEAEPVSMQVIKVVGELYRGEVKPVTAANPLNEKLTLQQVTDLAAKAGDYVFDWRITSPVDGLPPVSTENQRRLLLGDGTWNHLRFPLPSDIISGIAGAPAARVTPILLVQNSSDSINVIEAIPFTAVNMPSLYASNWTITAVQTLTGQNSVVLRGSNGDVVLGHATDATTPTTAVVAVDTVPPTGFTLAAFEESPQPASPSSVIYRTFTTSNSAQYTELWLSMNLAADLGVRVFLDGERIVSVNMGQFLGQEPDAASSTPPDGLSALPRAFRLGNEVLRNGAVGATETTHLLAVELYSLAAAAAFQTFNLRLEAFEEVDLTGGNWLALDPSKFPDGIRAIMGGTADVRSLSDNYLIMRYRPSDDLNGWSRWTSPALAEGWIKRVLAGINPFNQRVSDFFNNRVNTGASLVASAGTRWEGDVALNLANIDDHGLIPIYETVLRRGRGLSIDAGINFGPANDALLLAAGYLSDLYMILGNEARADAANPTIGIGTADRTYGDIATAMFAFKGQMASLLDEELALLRGRDDFLQPGAQIAPVYNRLVWNYTRGIDAGEVIYALNYNVQEDPNKDPDGVIGAEDAAAKYPQGHGDAYGHYLTALTGYYSLLIDDEFTWVPRVEAVNVLGVPVSVDYLDERKFAAAAVATAQTGQQVFELAWRADFEDPKLNGWEHFDDERTNTRLTPPTTRFWGMDHWASRNGQGALLHWVVGNAILPAVDNDPTHEGIQIVDRTTVAELAQLAAVAKELQSSMDNAEAGLNPLGLPAGSIAFDLNPSGGSTSGSGFAAGTTSHFEQVLDRAKTALRNAVTAFDDAKDITRLMRSEEDSLADLQAKVDSQEQAFNVELISLYGTPYPDDVGPGKTFPAGYTGPDLAHYAYVDNPELYFGGLIQSNQTVTYTLDIQARPNGYRGFETENDSSSISENGFDDIRIDRGTKSPGPSPKTLDFIVAGWAGSGLYQEGTHHINFTLNSHGFFEKPAAWKSQRASPGRLQQAISRIIRAHNAAQQSFKEHQFLKYQLDRQLDVLAQAVATLNFVDRYEDRIGWNEFLSVGIRAGADAATDWLNYGIKKIKDAKEAAVEGIPKTQIIGTSTGGDLTAPARGFVVQNANVLKWVLLGLEVVNETAAGAAILALGHDNHLTRENFIEPAQEEQLIREYVLPIDATLSELMLAANKINLALIDLEEAERELRAQEAKGLTLLEERLVFRKRAAALTQGYRSRDAAFRLFRNEKLERYKSLFDLSARYSYLAAQAFDYDTGLLGTPEGEAFIQRIIHARALGVVRNGQPQVAGSNTGDPGLSSVLAELEGDWQVLKSRLGFNNPDVYGTTVSLRQENYRILPNEDGDVTWKDLMAGHRMANILDDPDVRRYCMQVDPGNGLPVPGIVIPFSTAIAERVNLFGRQLAAGDSTFSRSSFATKIFSVGVALKGYRGMANPGLNSAVVGGNSPADPDITFLDQNALAATPYIYLVPVGADAMRSPPLGDESQIRSWNVSDVTIPMPFNIGGSQFSGNNLLAANTLTEPLFNIRKHPAFRPVSDAKAFAADNARLLPSTFTNSRLIGRSVWNTGWKLVIPGDTLLNDPNEGLDRFLRTVKDIQLHFETYSYSGN